MSIKEGKKVLLEFLTRTLISERKLVGEEGCLEQWQMGQSYQAIYKVKVAKTQPAAVYKVVNVSVSMTTWMNEKRESCF